MKSSGFDRGACAALRARVSPVKKERAARDTAAKVIDPKSMAEARVDVDAASAALWFPKSVNKSLIPPLRDPSPDIIDLATSSAAVGYRSDRMLVVQWAQR